MAWIVIYDTKSTAIKENINKMDFVKMNNQYASKDTGRKVKR